MKLAVKAAIVSLAVATAAPALAFAQYGPPHGPPPGVVPGGWDLDRRMDWMQHRIDRGIQDGSLDRREARRVQRQLNNLKAEFTRARARPGPLSTSTRVRFERRLDDLSDHMRWLRNNDERRPWAEDRR